MKIRKEGLNSKLEILQPIEFLDRYTKGTAEKRLALQHRVARSDPQYRAQEQQINNARRQQVQDSRQATFRALNYNVNDFFKCRVFKLWCH